MPQNEQVFKRLGYRFEFRPEKAVPDMEEERQRVASAEVLFNILKGGNRKDADKAALEALGVDLPQWFNWEVDESIIEQRELELEAQRAAVTNPQKPPAPKPKQPRADVEDGEKSVEAYENSAMIALRIPDAIRKEIKNKYPFIDAETLDNLHITLVYLGDNRTLDKLDIVRAVSDMGLFQAPIKGKLQGLRRSRVWG